jgi:hypothetical protein
MSLTNKNFKSSGKINIHASSERHLFEEFTNDFKIRYNLGKMPLYCYRVSGRGTLPYIFKPATGFNNEIVYSQIYNIFARSIREVPAKLKEGNFKGYVYKVYKYEKAVYNQEYANDISIGLIDPTNYGFLDVTKQFCELPDAGDFCTSLYEVIAKVEFTTNYARSFESKGSLRIKGRSVINNSTYFKYKVKLKIKNKINLTGSAVATGTNLLPTLNFQSTGKLKVTGTAKNQNNYLGFITFTTIGNIEIIDLNSFNKKINTFDPIANNTIIATACGCPVNTNLIYFANNIFKSNSLLDKFLYRNDYKPQEIIKLFYDNKNKTYFSSIKYDGYSLFEGSKESWNISTSLECTNKVDLNKSYLWLFSCSIKRKINNNKSSFIESKISLYLPSNLICATAIDALEFYYRANLKEMVVYNKFKDKITNIQISTFKDNIKLFNSGDWYSDPFFNIFIYSKPINIEQYLRPIIFLPQTNIRNAIEGRQEITKS